MSFTYTDEQSMLDETLTGLLSEFGAAAAAGDYRPDVWQAMVELGLPAMPFDEASGGLGSSSADQMVVQQAIGRSAMDLPFLSNSVMAGGILAALAAQGDELALVGSLVSGEACVSLAHDYPRSTRSGAPSDMIASPAEGGFVLSGTKPLVLQGDRASHLIVSAALKDCGEPWLFLVPSTEKGVDVVSNAGRAGVWSARISLNCAFVPLAGLLAEASKAGPLIRLAHDRALVATIYEMVGAMERLQTLTLDYLKLRKQFGVTLGSLQSLQHKAVDMYVELEQARSMAIYANAMLSADETQRHSAAIAAKLQVNRAARFVGETAVQLHGAIGMTMESDAGRVFRRLTALQFLFADSDQCLLELGHTSSSVLDD
ncbi:alkylation response protein AidB-like acyl-CoA dehydrogenase [Neorhizobium galegae]|uniref:acyl-CoA dehydrogenase family protein n=1 Tax=Neorhizobium galegae TaxID=399 RepID=UPI00277E7A13|nr:acyl-CoA dehydrogenase family protein [Neorhizobium galegae]MDQ0137755.1 alkylation response protein AidB-like acyl-CoA dehydrogenase [Neorhizobium galegae]